jgi:hypothetical protein
MVFVAIGCKIELRMEELARAEAQLWPGRPADRRRFLKLSRRRCLWCRAQRSHLPAANLAGSKHLFGALDLPIKIYNLPLSTAN